MKLPTTKFRLFKISYQGFRPKFIEKSVKIVKKFLRRTQTPWRGRLNFCPKANITPKLSFSPEEDDFFVPTTDHCRVCLNIASSSKYTVTGKIIELYSRLTTFKIQPSDIPQKLCADCFKLIHETAKFHEKVARTEETLDKFRLKCEEFDIKVELVESLVGLKEEKEVVVAFEAATPPPPSPPSPPPKRTYKKRTKEGKRPYKKRASQPVESKGPPEEIICELCGVRMPKSRIYSHNRFHHPTEFQQLKFYCDLCGRSYKSKSSLRVHIEQIHLKISAFPCPVCHEVFSIYANMRHHKLTKHHSAEDYKFQCEFCQKRFPHNGLLVAHRAVHSEVRAYCCPICTKPFKKKEAMKHHMQIHKTMEERCYRCPICPNKGFCAGWLLRHHMTHVHPQFPKIPVGAKMRNVDLNIYLTNKSEENS